MNSLKSIISAQKSAAPHAGHGRKWIQQKDIKRLREESAIQEQKECDAKRLKQVEERLKALDEYLGSGSSTSVQKETEVSTGSAAQEPGTAVDIDGNPESELLRWKAQDSADHLEDEDVEPPISTQEVFRRLRKAGQPATLFGESKMQRYKRLCRLEVASQEDELMHGQHNVLLQMTDRRKGRMAQDDDHDDDDDDEHCKPTANVSNLIGGNDEDQIKEAQDTSDPICDTTLSPSASVTQTAQEHRVREWIKLRLKEWDEELHERTEELNKTAEGKMQRAMHRQTRKDVKPLLKRLKQHKVDADFLSKLYGMVEACEAREYVAAHDMYIALAIGNAPWPMGVTMVGIHERAGRSKIFTSEIAHILNDETTRKYIQMFKRLMSFCQRRYPADDNAKMVNISTFHV